MGEGLMGGVFTPPLTENRNLPVNAKCYKKILSNMLLTFNYTSFSVGIAFLACAVGAVQPSNFQYQQPPPINTRDILII